MGKQQKLKQDRKLEELEREERGMERKKAFATIIVGALIIGFLSFGVWTFRDKLGLGISKNEPAAGTNSPSGEDLQGAGVTEPQSDKTAVLETNYGPIRLKLFTNVAPKTVENFERLAKSGFYDGVKFHRVIKDFMIQTGDPNSKDDNWSDDGTGGPDYTFEDEINEYKLLRGRLAMANRGPNTNGSQFFIVTASSTPWLDGKHTVFGEVTAGLDIVDKIEAVPTNTNDHPTEDVVITRITVTTN